MTKEQKMYNEVKKAVETPYNKNWWEKESFFYFKNILKTDVVLDYSNFKKSDGTPFDPKIADIDIEENGVNDFTEHGIPVWYINKLLGVPLNPSQSK